MRGEGYSLADIRAVTEGSNNGGAFGGDYGAWWIIIIIILFGGWGRNGFGGYGNGDSSTNSIPYFQSLDTDFATIERKIDGVYSGICDSTFALNNSIQNGFAAAQNTMTQGFAGLNTGMVQQGYENRIAVGNVANQLSQCCCDLKGIAKDNKYDFAQNINALNNSVNAGFVSVNQANCLNTRDIISSQENGTRAILEALNTDKLERKNEQISLLQTQLNNAELRASQENQTREIVNTIRPCPIPAYASCNPWGCNCNQGCGCNY